MKSRHHLLQLFLALLAAQGLSAQCLDPWKGWVTFKHFARIVDEIPDPGVSVQLAHCGNSSTSLFFLRQVLEPEGEDSLQPVGGVVCEFVFPRSDSSGTEWEIWSFDYPTFEQFVDSVEQHDDFAALTAKVPDWSDAYWEEA